MTHSQAIQFSLAWQSSAAQHNDHYRLQNYNPQQDQLPKQLQDKLAELKPGESFTATMSAKDFLGEANSSENVLSFKAELFNTQFKNQSSPAQLYRFYPRAIAWQGLNSHDKDYKPFRLISINQGKMTADCNHPLSKYYLTVTVTKPETLDTIATDESQKKKIKRNIPQLISSRGPGMQAPFEFGDSVFFKHYPLTKKEEGLLQKPLLDENTRKEIQTIYSDLLPIHSKTLDILSTESSYLAPDYQTGLLVGIGDTETQLAQNVRLNTYNVQNLNDEFTLPYETNSFDNAICSLGIDFLINPVAIFKEVARVVAPSGKFIISFTDQQNTEQSTDLWRTLHPFERMQLVLEYFRITGLYADLNTLSKRGIVKARQDNNSSKHNTSSVFAVWGSIK